MCGWIGFFLFFSPSGGHAIKQVKKTRITALTPTKKLYFKMNSFYSLLKSWAADLKKL